MSLLSRRSFSSLALGGLLAPRPAAAAVHDARSHGARGDGSTNDTAAIQAAVDAAARAGGVVLLSPGSYCCGTVHLKSNITLELSPGAVLLASLRDGDFDPPGQAAGEAFDDAETGDYRHALLAGESLENLAIRGDGLIDGNRLKRGGPKTIALKNCRRVSISSLAIERAPGYAIGLLGCDDVRIDGLRISQAFSAGIGIDCSHIVRVSNCHIDSAGDALCLKASNALGEARSTEEVAVINCVLRTSSNHFKLGSESRGDFRNITCGNCVMLRRPRGRAPIAGLAIESVDGGVIDGVSISGIVMEEAGTPIFIRLGNRGRGMQNPAAGDIRNVIISSIVARDAIIASSVTGLSGHPVKDLTLSNLHVSMVGGASFSGIEVPELAGNYPEATMFGQLPAHTLYLRHVEMASITNLKTRWHKADRRPALVADSVREVELHGFRSETATGSQPVIWLHNSSGVMIAGSRLMRDVNEFLRVSGSSSRQISLLGNDLRAARKTVEFAAGAGRSSVVMNGNLVSGGLPVVD